MLVVLKLAITNLFSSCQYYANAIVLKTKCSYKIIVASFYISERADLAGNLPCQKSANREKELKMWSGCHPKSDEDLKECSELGKSLSRLSQPTILTLLAQADEPLHGYSIVQKAAHSPMFGGKKPDATGVYRALKRMEEAGLVSSEWATPAEGSAKRMFSLTDKGLKCLRRWIDALACYELTIEELRGQASTALGIDVPPTPECSHAD